MPSNRAVGAARVPALYAATLALLISLLAVAASPASADPPPTETSWSTRCLVPNVLAVVYQPGPSLTVEAVAPPTVPHGEVFQLELSPLEVSAPDGQGSSVAQIVWWRDVTLRYQVSRNAAIEGAVVVPGTPGAEGATASVEVDDRGTPYVVLDVPTPSAPEGGTSHLPGVVVQLRALGPAGSEVTAQLSVDRSGPATIEYTALARLGGFERVVESPCWADSESAPPIAGSTTEGGPVDVASTTSLEVEGPGVEMVGASVWLTASVSAVGGEVHFWDEDILLGVTPVDGRGLAVLQARLEHVGTRMLRAELVGAPGYAGSTSADVEVLVEPGPPPPAFSDVGPGHVFHDEIIGLAEAGIVTGYPDGSFGPQRMVTRQALASFLDRLLGNGDLGECAEAPFADVPVDHPFCASIDWSATEGWATGYDDGMFGPGRPATRQALVALLYRAAASLGGEDVACEVAPFPDVPVDHTFCGPVAWAVSEGIVAGYDDGLFRPDEPVTRAAAAAILARWVG